MLGHDLAFADAAVFAESAQPGQRGRAWQRYFVQKRFGNKKFRQEPHPGPGNGTGIGPLNQTDTS